MGRVSLSSIDACGRDAWCYLSEHFLMQKHEINMQAQ